MSAMYQFKNNPAKWFLCAALLFLGNGMLRAQNVPAITSFTPAAGASGTTISIVGTNFDATAASNIVYFGAVRAVVLSASVTNLTVTVPVGATFDLITETVDGLTAYSGAPFLVTFNGSGTISSASLAARLDLPAGSSPFRVVIADLDGDGKPDLMASQGSPN